MPNTTNFNWATPADTDLVKDGAAAIRTLGNSIDASLVDLKGGTTGQVLSKASNTDLDFTWTNGGDITEVAAGVGISGGGTSGSVTITNSMATAIDAKGDLIVGTGADTFSRLAYSGVNNEILTIDTSTSTGLKWAAAAAPSLVGARAKMTTSQSVANSTSTTINFGGEDWDTDGFHSNTVNNSRLTIPTGKSGYYQFNAKIVFDAGATGIRAVNVEKNGAGFNHGTQVQTTSAQEPVPFYVGEDYFNAGDYITVSVWHNQGTNLAILGGTFTIRYIGA